MRDLFKDIDNRQCALDVYIKEGKLDRRTAKVSKYFLEECDTQLRKVYSNRSLFFHKYEYEKILNEYLRKKYKTVNLKIDLNPCEDDIKHNNKKKDVVKPSDQMDKRQNDIINFLTGNISKMQWGRTSTSYKTVYQAVYNDMVYQIADFKQKEKSGYGYWLKFNYKVIETDESRIVELLNAIKKTKLQENITVLIPKQESNIDSGKKHKNDTEKHKKGKKKSEKQKKENKNNLKESKPKIIKKSASSSFILPSYDCQDLQQKYSISQETINKICKDYRSNCKVRSKNMCNSKGEFCSSPLIRCPHHSLFISVLREEAYKARKKHDDDNLLPKQKLTKSIDALTKKEKRKKENNNKENLPIINAKDFVVRTQVFRCMHNSHNIENIDAMLYVTNDDGKKEACRVSAGYCPVCKVYFIMESTYKKLKQKGIITCRITDDKTYMKGGFMSGAKLAQESILMQYGYNVSQTKGLSETRRQKILAVIIDNKVLSKGEIISYLDFFIRQRSTLNNMGVAISKWEADREFVENYKIGHYTQYGVNAIYHR